MSRYCAACFGLGMYNARVEDEMKKFAEAQQYFCVFTSRKGKTRNSSSTYLFMPRSFFYSLNTTRTVVCSELFLARASSELIAIKLAIKNCRNFFLRASQIFFVFFKLRSFFYGSDTIVLYSHQSRRRDVKKVPAATGDTISTFEKNKIHIHRCSHALN